MNYRHSFHAGNFADVHKHVTLLALIERLKRKPAACFLLDTHAGRGWYDLGSADTGRGSEWQEGIGRLCNAQPTSADLKRYLELTGPGHTARKPGRYAGSPIVMLHARRAIDRVVLCEKQHDEARALEIATRGERGVSVINADGYALKTWLPPKENRGLVLIDPPYEAPDEIADVERALTLGLGRWPNGIFAVWFPIKAGGESRRFLAALGASGLRKLLRLELSIRPDDSPVGLNGSGLVIANPPWRFDVEMREVMAQLHGFMSPGGGGKTEVEWLVPE